MADHARTEAPGQAPSYLSRARGLYLWYVDELGAPFYSLGVYTHPPAVSEGGHIKSVRLDRWVPDTAVTAYGLVLGAEKFTELRDYADEKLRQLIP